MNENTNWTAIAGVALTASGLVWAFFKRFFASVTREELERTMERMHEENRARLESINDTVTSTHRRVDELYRDFGMGR